MTQNHFKLGVILKRDLKIEKCIKMYSSTYKIHTSKQLHSTV